MRIISEEVYGIEFSVRVSGFPMKTIIDGVESEENSHKRATKLGNAKIGSGHACFLKGIVVNFELEYDVFWSPQIQRYHFIDFVSSSSSVHKAKLGINANKYVDKRLLEISQEYIDKYNENPCPETLECMLSNLPQGQLKFAGKTTNYLQLKSIYNQRKCHKLDIWKKFCAWCESLPNFVEYALNGKRLFTNDENLPIEEKYNWRN